MKIKYAKFLSTLIDGQIRNNVIHNIVFFKFPKFESNREMRKLSRQKLQNLTNLTYFDN